MSIRGQVLRSNVDMTQGRPLNVIFSFALPLLMGNLFNQLYNVVDTAILGRALGADALAAVGSTGNINACLFLLLAGLATGVSVIVSQYWGAGRYDELRRLLGTFLTLLLAASVVMSLLGVLLAEPMLRLLQVPENLLDAGVTYLRITAGLLLGNALYNAAGAVLRSTGGFPHAVGRYGGFQPLQHCVGPVVYLGAAHGGSRGSIGNGSGTVPFCRGLPLRTMAAETALCICLGTALF